MEFNLSELKPTYRFKQGMPGSSYAFEVAKRIGVKDDLIVAAKKNIKDDSNRIEEFLIDLEQKTNKMRDKLNEYEIYSLNPFINFGLEGHKYERQFIPNYL